ncbi:MAG TPA: POT family MFS transporter [Anaeromyxobacteraceae bacterium]|nr:POT family MFS transporter [Anaeromyxobacteraceae bacterium]
MSDGKLRHPPQVGYIVGSEAAERFSFYGMQSILTVYMLDWLLYAQGDTKALYHVFTMAVYLTPLVGGWLADRFFGRYAIILWVSLGYVAGHAVLALWETREGLLVGLALIALGAGGIKPCVSAFVGDQFGPSENRLLGRVYNWFYFSINLGSAASKLLVPWLLKTAGPAIAFAVPGVLMAVALLVFWLGRGRYVRAAPSGPNPHAFVRVVATALKKLGTGRPGEHWLDAARASHPEEAIVGAKAVFRIAGIFAAVTFFWALFDQKGSSWVLQAKEMDLRVGDVELAASQLQALNPFMVMGLIPFFTFVAFPALERRGIPLDALRKMTAGMFVTVLSFVAAALVQTAIDGGATPDVLWQVPQYLLLTSGEVLVSVTGLEFSYTQAPRSMRSTIMSIWYLAVGSGNLLTALVSKLFFFQGAAYFWFFAALMLVAAILFALVARRYRPVAPAFPEPVRAAAGG